MLLKIRNETFLWITRYEIDSIHSLWYALLRECRIQSISSQIVMWRSFFCLSSPRLHCVCQLLNDCIKCDCRFWLFVTKMMNVCIMDCAVVPSWRLSSSTWFISDGDVNAWLDNTKDTKKTHPISLDSPTIANCLYSAYIYTILYLIWNANLCIYIRVTTYHHLYFDASSLCL